MVFFHILFTISASVRVNRPEAKEEEVALLLKKWLVQGKIRKDR